jgi:hypothetical protein
VDRKNELTPFFPPAVIPAGHRRIDEMSAGDRHGCNSLEVQRTLPNRRPCVMDTMHVLFPLSLARIAPHVPAFQTHRQRQGIH